MKKLLAALLAMTMVVSLVACGGGEDTKKTTEAPKTEANDGKEDETPAADSGELVYEGQLSMAWWGNQVRNERTEGMLDLYMEKHPDVTFNQSAYVWNDYWTTLAVSQASSTLPDIIQQDYAYIEQFVKVDDLVDLRPYTETGAFDISKIEENVIKTGQVAGDDGIYAICAGLNAPAMLYNKTLTDSLGIEVPDNITMEQFAEISKKIYDETGVKTNYGYGKSENQTTYYIRSKGNTAFFEVGALAYDDYTMLTGWFDWMQKSIDEGWQIDVAIAAETADAIEQSPIVYFTSPNTQSWMTCCFSNQIDSYADSASKLAEPIELGITSWPSEVPANSNYLKSSQFYSVTTDSKNEALAVDVINFFVNDVDCNNILLAERGIPANVDVAAAIFDNMTPGNQMASEYLEVVAANCSEIFPPLPNGTNEVVALIGTTIEEFMYGELDADAAAKKIFDEGNKIMAGYAE